MKSFTVREATASDSPGIRRLFGRTFGVEQTEEEWLWKYARNPDGWYGVVAERDGEIVGNYAGWGMRFLVNGEERVVYAVGDVATDPSARGLGRAAYREIAGAFFESLDARGVPFCFGFPNDRHLDISRNLIATRSLFPVRELRVPIAAFPACPPDARARAAETAGEEVDSLWSAARPVITDGAVRDRQRANWRFHARPTRYYRMVTIGEAGAARAWGVLSVVGEKALIADFLDGSPDGAALGSLFSAAAEEAGRMGARFLAFWESPGGSAPAALAGLPVERVDAGFSLAIQTRDEAQADRFARRIRLVPALWDVV